MSIQYVTNREFILEHLLNGKCILAADDEYMLMTHNSIYHLSLETMRDIRPLLEMMSAPYPTYFWLSEVGINIIKEQSFWANHARANSVSHAREAGLIETYLHIKSLRPGVLLCWKTSSGKWLSSVSLRKLADKGLIRYEPPPFPDMFLSGRYFVLG